jgi:uncharacterized protein (TIGR01615 family)
MLTRLFAHTIFSMRKGARIPRDLGDIFFERFGPTMTNPLLFELFEFRFLLFEQKKLTCPLSSPKNRIVGNLSRPRDALEHNIAKRFAAACTHVGVGELGDAAHIEALQRAFNGLKMDPVLGYEPVAKTAADYAANAGCAAPSDSPAFVATTPGAAGHAALLNLRHSFLWLKPSDAAADAAHCPLTKRGGCVGGGGDARHHGSQRQGDAEILVLEPDIKAHFVIAKPTHGYRRLVDALPDHFVGTHKRLVELVDFVCEQMLVSFRETGMSVPPWRKNKSILSKWFLPTAKSGSQPTTPTGSPASAAQAVLQRQSFGFGARVGEQPRQLSFVRMNLGESGSPPMEYAAPVVGENASPNKVAFGFSAGTVRSIAVPA